MCGISGIVARDRQFTIPDDWISRMMSVQTHRGPDDRYAVRFPGCLLGFNRLSVQDISLSGRQPMSVDGSPASIVFNGEIYNFVELSGIHRSRGIQFRSRSDTEVLLQSLLWRGEESLKSLNGMWAFAVYDPLMETLFASRDRFGVKPFYYFQNKDFFCFASEIKALLELPFVPRQPNLRVLFAGTFERGNDRSGETAFAGISQLPPARYLRVSRGSWRPLIHRYWAIDPPEPQACELSDEAMEQAGEEFRSLMQSAVAIRLRSDRPVGLLLSGGLDSSTIASHLAPGAGGSGHPGEVRHLFTMALRGEAIDESQSALETARRLGLPCRLLEASAPEFERLLPLTIWHNDEPIPLLNRCVHWWMMERIAEDGIIVVLNGQGGDECTGGYFDRLVGSTLRMGLRAEGVTGLLREWEGGRSVSGFTRSWMFRQFLKTFVSHSLVRGWRAVSNEQAFGLARWGLIGKGILRDHSPRLVKTDAVNDQLMRWLNRDTVPDLCHYEDRNSAAHGLEERFPFLDYRIAEFFFRLPWHFKTYRGVSKVLVRRAMETRLPDNILRNHRKIGFGVPEDKWIRGPLAEWVRDLVAARAFRERGLWRVSQVRSLVDRHIAGEVNRGNLIWRVAAVEAWFRMFLDRTWSPPTRTAGGARRELPVLPALVPGGHPPGARPSE